MLIQAITIFPEMFDSIVEYGVTGRARKQNLWQFQVHLFSLLTDGVKIANANTDERLNRP